LKRSVAAVTVLALLVLGPPASAQTGGGQALKPRLSAPELVEALKGGGYVILMRHMSTEPVAPDPAFFDIRDCSTQRGLSPFGRDQAKRIGAAFESLGIQVGEVYSSPYCRCLETGKLAFGKVEELELLSVSDRLPVPEKDARGKEVRKLLGTDPPPGKNTILITHSGTLLYSFGLDTKPEGVAHVFKPGPVGTSFYMAKLAPEEWARAAGLAAPAQ